MSGETGPTLDEEGVPDLQGPLPAKEATGDPQEGVAPPGVRPRASVDWGVTPEEQRSSEPLDVRIAREVPESGETDPVDEVADDLRLAEDPLRSMPSARRSTTTTGDRGAHLDPRPAEIGVVDVLRELECPDRFDPPCPMWSPHGEGAGSTTGLQEMPHHPIG